MVHIDLYCLHHRLTIHGLDAVDNELSASHFHRMIAKFIGATASTL